MSEKIEKTTPEVRETKRRTAKGTVVSRSMKTINVSHERRVQHPRYKKYIRRVSKFLAHDEKDEAKIGDIVLLMECRPISKQKSWRLVEILTKAKSMAQETAEPQSQESSPGTPPT
ncbi:MAG: 30S ribosomal protein S17 [Planctomycetota bacterium]